MPLFFLHTTLHKMSKRQNTIIFKENHHHGLEFLRRQNEIIVKKSKKKLVGKYSSCLKEKKIEQ